MWRCDRLATCPGSHLHPTVDEIGSSNLMAPKGIQKMEGGREGEWEGWMEGCIVGERTLKMLLFTSNNDLFCGGSLFKLKYRVGTAL